MSSDLIKGILEKNKLSISQGISLVENNSEFAPNLLSDLFQFTGNAFRLGITGPPGAGKSSIVNGLVKRFYKQNKSIAVIAVDPTSPFSGGAVLGDRIRMNSLDINSNIFFRSLATRGSQGGLASQAINIGNIFDAANFDVIIFETVGVGQIELDIIKAVESVIVVLVPESGDEVQILKAGLMEIGNLFAINKSDRPGSNKLATSLHNILTSKTYKPNEWEPKIIQTIATSEKGLEELIINIDLHEKFNKNYKLDKQKLDTRYKQSLNKIINAELGKKFWNHHRIQVLNNELLKEYQNRASPQVLSEKLILNE